MNDKQGTSTVRYVETPSGRISHVEAGSGPVALFVHGVLLNKHLWRHQLAGLSDIRGVSRSIYSRMETPRSRPKWSRTAG